MQHVARVHEVSLRALSTWRVGCRDSGGAQTPSENPRKLVELRWPWLTHHSTRRRGRAWLLGSERSPGRAPGPPRRRGSASAWRRQRLLLPGGRQGASRGGRRGEARGARQAPRLGGEGGAAAPPRGPARKEPSRHEPRPRGGRLPRHRWKHPRALVRRRMQLRAYIRSKIAVSG